MAITIKDSGCNGWAAYESQFIEGSGPCNVHVVEVLLEKDTDGKIWATPTVGLGTVCGERKLISGKRTYLFATTNLDEMRCELARLQNSGKEICGQCVSCFYAD